MFEGYIVGIFPRNDILIDTWKKWERGKVSEKIFREELDKALEKIVKIQDIAGLSYIHDPQIDWHDMFRPFTYLENIVAGPLTRFFENNTFYKMPIIKDVVGYEKGFIIQYTHKDKLPKGKKWVISLPGPYTFYRLSEFKDMEIGRKSILNMLTGAMEDLVGEGYGFIVLHEPALAYYDDIDWRLVNEFYTALKELDIEYRVQLYFGDIKDKAKYVMEIAPHGFSVDTTFTSLDEIKNLNLDRVMLGVIDAQNTLMENPDDLANMIRRFVDESGFKEVAITPNTDLDYLPYEVAEAKLMLLSEVLRRLGA